MKEFKKRMPAKFLPIADDGMGNLIVLCLDSTNFGKVYFWDANVEWDEEDYLEEKSELPDWWKGELARRDVLFINNQIDKSAIIDFVNNS